MRNTFLSILLFSSSILFATTPLHLLTYNIRNCKGMDNNTNYERVASIITNQKPDVVALQELDSVTERSNGVDVLQTLAQLTKMHPTYGAAIPYKGGKYGVGILSQTPPINYYTIALPGREEARVILIAEFEFYLFCSTHFSLTAADRESSATILMELFKDVEKPVFIAGDLNDIPTSSSVKQLCTRFTLLNDPAQFTIPSTLPNRCIDYILGYCPNKKTVKVFHKIVLNEPMASDHLPVSVKLHLQ